MTFEEVLAEWEIDSPIDETKLIQASVDSGRLHHKYLKMFAEARMALHHMKAQYKLLQGLKYSYYSGDLDAQTLKEHGWEQWSKKIPRPDLQTYVDADEQVVRATLKLAKQQELVDVLNEILKHLSNRSYNITNAINMKKFLAGD